MNGVLDAIHIRQKDVNFYAASFNPLQENSTDGSMRDVADGMQALVDQTGNRLNEKLTSLTDLKVRFNGELSKLDREINGLDNTMKIWTRRSRIWAIGSRKTSRHPERRSGL